MDKSSFTLDFLATKLKQFLYAFANCCEFTLSPTTHSSVGTIVYEMRKLRHE